MEEGQSAGDSRKLAFIARMRSSGRYSERQMDVFAAYLMHCTDDNGVGYVDISVLSSECGISEMTARNHIKTFISSQLIYPTELRVRPGRLRQSVECAVRRFTVKDG
jgi:hypothetical protein